MWYFRNHFNMISVFSQDTFMNRMFTKHININVFYFDQFNAHLLTKKINTSYWSQSVKGFILIFNLFYNFEYVLFIFQCKYIKAHFIWKSVISVCVLFPQSLISYPTSSADELQNPVGSLCPASRPESLAGAWGEHASGWSRMERCGIWKSEREFNAGGWEALFLLSSLLSVPLSAQHLARLWPLYKNTHKYTLAPTSHILHHLYPLGPPCPCHLHCAGDVSV